MKRHAGPSPLASILSEPPAPKPLRKIFEECVERNFKILGVHPVHERLALMRWWLKNPSAVGFRDFEDTQVAAFANFLASEEGFSRANRFLRKWRWEERKRTESPSRILASDGDDPFGEEVPR